MKRFLISGLLAALLGGQAGAAEKPKRSIVPEDYLNKISAMAEYRSQVETAVMDVKKRLPANSAQYNDCRYIYARAEENVELYLTALSDSLQKQERSPLLLQAADLAARSSEDFLGCTVTQKSLGARLIPISPFVEFAIVCLEKFLTRKHRGLDQTAELLTSELRWKSWDRIR